MGLFDDIFLQEQSEVSGRWAIFDERGDHAYLHITEKDDLDHVTSVLVYTKQLVPAHHEACQSNPPKMLSFEDASIDAMRAGLEKKHISFLWSPKGNAVALCIKGEPVAFVTARGQYAFTKALERATHFGMPWNHQGFESLFAQPA